MTLNDSFGPSSHSPAPGLETAESSHRYVETQIAERAQHRTAEEVQTTCSLARAERLIGREYHGRFLIELLQNAADAWHKTATNGTRSRVRIVLTEEPALLVANQGQPFPAKAVIESLGHIGRSTKAHGEAIGYKGIGFKSVLELTLTPELYSGSTAAENTLAVRFDPHRALERIRAASSPNWDRYIAEIEDMRDDPVAAVPILRFPEWIDDPPPTVAALHDEGFVTVIRLPFDARFAERLDVDRDRWIAVVRDAFSDVTDQILLLLGAFDQVRIDDRIASTTEVIAPEWSPPSEVPADARMESVTVRRNERPSSWWTLFRRTLPGGADLAAEIAVALRLNSDEPLAAVMPPMSDDPSAPFHLFFPARIGSGLPLLLHGYFEVNAARTAFYSGSIEHNRQILGELAKLVAIAVGHTAHQRIADPATLLDLIAAAPPPEDPLARDFRSEVLDLLDGVAWVPLEDTDLRFGTPISLLADTRAKVARQIIQTFPSKYIEAASGMAAPALRISDRGFAYLASRAPEAARGLWDVLAALFRPGDQPPWGPGTEDAGFLALLELIAVLEVADRRSTERLLGALRGESTARLLPVVAPGGGRTLLPVPDPAEAAVGRRTRFVMARVRAPGETEIVPPDALDVAFLPDGLLADEAHVDRAKPLGVRPFTVDNVIDRLTNLQSTSSDVTTFLWRLLTREGLSEYGVRNCADRARTFEPSEWFWCRPGRAAGAESDRQRRERNLAGVMLPARSGMWHPAGTLVFGADWAEWLRSSQAGPISGATAQRIAIYEALEAIRPSDDAMLAPPEVVLPLLADYPTDDSIETTVQVDGEPPDAVRCREKHAFLLRLGVWEVPPIEAFENRTMRDRPRFPWTEQFHELQVKEVESSGGWVFDAYRWSGARHHAVWVAEDYRFRWNLDAAAERDAIALVRCLNAGAVLYRQRAKLAVFCPTCSDGGARHSVQYQSGPDDHYPSLLAIELRHGRWVPAVRSDQAEEHAVSSSAVWWSPAVPTGAALQQSPLRFLRVCNPQAHLGDYLRDLARIPSLDDASIASLRQLLLDLRREYEDGQLLGDPATSSSARQSLVGLHRLVYERLGAFSNSDRVAIAETLEVTGVLCEVGDQLEYHDTETVRHDDGRFLEYRRYFSGAVPFAVLARDKRSLAEQLGIAPFIVTLVRRGGDEGRDVTDDVRDLLADRIPQLLAIVVHHTLGTETLEPTSQQFEQRARRLRNLRIHQVNDLVVDARVEGTDAKATIGEGTEHDLFLENSTSANPILFHDLKGDGWQDQLRRRIAPYFATILENPAYRATFALFLLADSDSAREEALHDLGIMPEDVDAIAARVGAVSEEDRRRHQRWFAGILTSLGSTGGAPNEDLHDALVAAGLPSGVAGQLLELGGGVAVRRETVEGSALRLLAQHGVDLTALDTQLRETGDVGLDIRVARVRLRSWTRENGRRVAAVLALHLPPASAKAAVETWLPSPSLRHNLDPPMTSVLDPAVASLRDVGLTPEADRLADDASGELARLAGVAASTDLDQLVSQLYDAEEWQRILQAAASAWRRELTILGVAARTSSRDSRAVIRQYAAAVERLLPLNPLTPEALQPALSELLSAHVKLADTLTRLLQDRLNVAPPEREVLFDIAIANGLDADRLRVVQLTLDTPMRERARQLQETAAVLRQHSIRPEIPESLRAMKPKTRSIDSKKAVPKIKVFATADERKRRRGDEGERWAVAAALNPIVALGLAERRRAIDAIVALLVGSFDGPAVDEALAHAAISRDADLDEEELIEELSALLHVSRYSDRFGFDVLAWLPSVKGAQPAAICLEVKSSADRTFHLSRSEWELAERLDSAGSGDQYAVLVVRRARGGGPPTGLDLLVDPVALAASEQLTRIADSYVMAYASG